MEEDNTYTGSLQDLLTQTSEVLEQLKNKEHLTKLEVERILEYEEIIKGLD